MKRMLAQWTDISGRLSNYFKTPTQTNAPRTADHYIKLGWKILGGGLGLFLLWAFFAPLDAGVTVPAYVISEGERKAVQHLTGGIVDKVLVKEGDQVELGQTLVLMSPINQNAKLDSTTSAIATLDENIRHKERQLTLLNQQLNNLKSLAAEGFAPKNKALELERTKYQLQDSLATDQGRRAELVAQLPAIEFDRTNTEINAPVAGHVVGLSIFTDGGVVAPGAKLMEIAPKEAPLVVSGELPVHLIDKVEPGLSVEMMFTAFNQNRTPHIPGTLTVVGKDRLVDEKTGIPYYKVQAIASTEGAAMINQLKVRPGMPVELFIKTGERSLVSYLLKPIIDRVHSAMREN